MKKAIVLFICITLIGCTTTRYDNAVKKHVDELEKISYEIDTLAIKRIDEIACRRYNEEEFLHIIWSEVYIEVVKLEQVYKQIALETYEVDSEKSDLRDAISAQKLSLQMKDKFIKQSNKSFLKQRRKAKEAKNCENTN